MYVWRCLLVTLVACSLVGSSHSARILGLFPGPGKSHMIVFSALTKELASRGHDVTVYSSFPLDEKQPHYTDVKIDESIKAMAASGIHTLFDMKGYTNFVHLMNLMWTFGLNYCETVLQHPEMQKLIHSQDQHFDLIIIEAFFNECMQGFSHKFKAPVVQITSFGASHWNFDMVGNPTPLSHVPVLGVEFPHIETFTERFLNSAYGAYSLFMRYFYYMPAQDDIMRRYFKELDDLPSVQELESRTSLVLLNNHVTLNIPRPYVPSMIEVGGMHIKPAQKLPKDLQKFLDESKDGAIYFSLGSNLRSADLPEDKRSIFLNVFSKLKQRVLWKWETDTLPGQSANVKLGKWLPQSDILGHPNLRLFITHGGLLSTQEAVYHGVPLLGLPIYGDQELNMRRAETAGYALKLDLDHLTEESLSSVVNQLLSEPRFKQNVKKLSTLYRDQPQTPLQTAVYWTEYVLRHKGAPHLRSAALDLSWYQYLLLDVLAVFVIGSAAVLVTSYIILKTVLRLLMAILFSNGKPKSNEETGKKKEN